MPVPRLRLEPKSPISRRSTIDESCLLLLKRLPDRELEALGTVREVNAIAFGCVERDSVAEAEDTQRRRKPLHRKTGRIPQGMIAEIVVDGGFEALDWQGTRLSSSHLII